MNFAAQPDFFHAYIDVHSPESWKPSVLALQIWSDGITELYLAFGRG